MKPDEKNIEEVLRRALPSAPRAQMEPALDRVLARLRTDRAWTTPQAVAPLEPARATALWWRPAMTVAAAAVLIAAFIWGGIPWRDQGVYAVLEAADASLYRISDGNRVPVRTGERIREQETVRSNGGSGAMLALADGSRVEMRSQSELSFERADDGVRIRLSTGGIIVDAAEQRTGHLYVQTKDVNVSVVGTVFVVNAADEGSRVAVIDGQVRVRERNVETTLRPGEQVSTSAALAVRPLKEEIAWSRHADAYSAILNSFMKGIVETAGPLRPLTNAARAKAAQSNAAAAQPAFEEASIRECDPDNLPPTPAGARGGGANSFQMTPGRTYALCMTLATLIRTAYGYGPAALEFLNAGRLGGGRGMSFNIVYGLGVEDGLRVRGGPDWVRSERYTIEAVAEGAADAETMRGPMLRSLIERRFQLKTHIETEQMPAWTLTIASSGLKIKPVETDAVDRSGFVNTTVKDGGACELQPTVGRGQPLIVRPAQPGERQPPPTSTPGQPVTILFRNFVDVRRGEKPTCGMSMQRNGPNQVIVAGGTTLEALGRSLASPLGGVIVTDKTGNTDKFNIVLEFVRDENTPGPSFLTPNQPEPSSDVPRGQTIFAALEEQLGLRLEPARVPREFIVIDTVERPSPN